VDHEEKVIRQLVDFLQGCDFTGVIFSRVAVEGTFPLDAIRINTTNVMPDVVIAMRWVDEKNELGTPGLVIADGGTRGKGTHGSLSPYDAHCNILVAAGPDFKKGLINDTPSGNIDLVPNVLWILGINPPKPLDGRVWHEALAASDAPSLKVESETLKATREMGLFRWQQYLKVSKVGPTVYFDEGNGEQVAK
jgi:hypothetical protein